MNSAKIYRIRLPERDKLGRFTKKTITPTQERDKFGRFATGSRLWQLKRQQPRERDRYGRFVSSAKQRIVKRDRYGRFAKHTPVWWRRRTVLLLPLIILGVGGVLFFSLQLNKTIAIEEPVAVTAVPAAEVIALVKPEQSEALPRSEPTRLRISKVGIDSSFVLLGKKADGTIEVPGGYDKVGWYTLGPTPGELGPAVVVGHVDRPGGTAVFWRLRELLPGDMFEVDRADGKTVKFKVDAVKQLAQDDFPTDEVYGNIDHAGIRLITCGGTFNRTTRHYSHNTVVYGSLVPQNNVSSNLSL